MSSQYHVLYDDLFSTVPNAEHGGAPEPTQDRNFWLKLLETGVESYLPDLDPDEDEVTPFWGMNG